MTVRLAAVGLSLFVSLALTACDARHGAVRPAPPSAEPAGEPKVQPASHSGWRSVATVEGATLTYTDGSDRPIITLACIGTDLRVRVPGFRKIGSEDRLTVGAGDEAFALVADLASVGPGVIAAGAVPPELIDRIAQEQKIAAVYGVQTLDTLPTPSAETSRAFVSACRAK